MTARCPCCRARLRGAVQCPRCRADLSALFKVWQAASFYLAKAIQDWQAGRYEQSLVALEQSMKLHKTELALSFRDFLVHQQCQAVLALLADKQLWKARQQLYRGRRLLPCSELLQQLQLFIDDLLFQETDDKSGHLSSIPL